MSLPRFLLLEDKPLDTEIIQAMLTDGGVDCELLRVDTRADFVTALETDRFDLILAAYAMPGLDGIAALEIAHHLCPETPFIFVSGSLGEELAIETLKRGATDYVLKQRLERLVPAVQRALREAQERRDFKKAERERERFLVISSDLQMIIGYDHKIQWVSPSFERLLGWSASEIIGQPWFNFTHPDNIDEIHQTGSPEISYSEPFTFENRYRHKDGSYRWFLWNIQLYLTERVIYVAAVDITNRKRTELNKEFLATVSQNLVEATRVDEIVQAVGAGLNRYLQVSACVFVEINERADEATVKYDWHQGDRPSLMGVYPMSEFVADEIYQTAQAGQPIVIRNYATDPRVIDPCRYAALGIGAEINIPLIRDGAWKFSLIVFHQQPYDWRDDEIELMQELASRIWAKLERARAEAALSESRNELERQVQKFDVTLSTIADYVFSFDRDGRFLYANQALLDLWGLTAAEAIGKTMPELDYPETAEQPVLNNIRRVFETGESVKDEAPYTSRTGVEGYFEYIFNPVFAADGTVDYIIGSSRNIRDRKQAEAALRESETRLRFMLDASQIGDWDLDLTTEPHTAHRSLRHDQIFGYESLLPEWSYEIFLSHVHPDDRVTVNQQFQQTLSASTNWNFECRIIRSDQSIHWIWVHSSVYCDSSGTPTRLLGMVMDITDRIQTEAALRQSEERYRTLFESIDEGFCVVEVMVDQHNTPVDYRILEINPTFEQQTGIPQAVGKTARQLNLEDHWIEIYGRVALTGEPIRFESGSDVLGRWFDVYACRTGEPEARKVAIVFKDISDRKQAEAIIATDLKNTRLLRDLSARLINEDEIQVLYDEIMATAIALTKADAGTVQILDKATQDLLLLASQGFNRTMTDHFYRVNASSNTSCGIALTRGTRTFIDFDVPECDDPDGSLRRHVNAGYLSAQSTPLISRSGKAIGMVSTHWCRQHRPSDRELRFLDLLARQAADLIEQRQTEAERQQILQREQAAREEAERANRIKDEFLAVLSHELRSPLNPILGWAKLLQQGKLDAAKTKTALATIERNAQLQSQLISDLLDISRILRGKLSLDQSPVDLRVVISSALETVRLAAEAKSLHIETVYSPDIGTVLGDAGRLQQVVWNLLSNAVKFTPPSGQITIALTQTETHAQIQVIDTGKGISPDFLPYVFEHFRQEDGATTRKFGGLGLGLAIARQIIEMHGGQISVDSSGEGQGATFTVQLPLGSRESGVGSRDNVDSPLSTPHSPLTDLRILVVDDETDSREFVAFVLEQAGAIVISVASGIEALQAIEQSVADLIVSDIGMPEMDGYMLLQQIRGLEPTRDVPAIALTAYAGEFDRQQAIAVGFQQHLAKPVEPDALVRTIATLAGGNYGDRSGG